MMDRVFLGNSIRDYVVAATVLCAGLLVVRVGIRVVLGAVQRAAHRRAAAADNVAVTLLKKVVAPALTLSCVYISAQILTLPAAMGRTLNALEIAVITFFVARMAVLLIGFGITLYVSNKQDDPTLVRSLEGMKGAIKFVVWALAVIILLDNLGYKVSTLLAGLGIGGVAVAIAAQALLKDFFSYFSIVFDHPFKLGDFIIVGDFMGTVEYIGIKTTRIRSLTGEQLVFSNTDLTDSRVRNYRLMEKRRVVFRLGVTYQTPLQRLKEIPGLIESIIKGIDGAVFDRAHFFSYGDFSLVFEIVYYVIGSDYTKYMDIQQTINLSLYEAFEQRGISFAHPTQTVFLAGADGPRPCAG